MAEPQDTAPTLVLHDPRLHRRFVQIPEEVLFLPGLSSGAKVTYAVLLHYAWQDGACFPGMERLCRDLEASEPTARKMLRELEGCRLIRVERRGLTKTNVYHFLLLSEAGQGPPPARTPMDAATKAALRDRSVPERNTPFAQERKAVPERNTPFAQERNTRSAHTKEGVDPGDKDTENALGVSTPSARAAPANDVTLLAETWMKANIIDPAQAIGGTIVQYRKWAKDSLTRWDRATITRLLRYQYSQRKARGEQYTITPALLDQRIGQWQEMGSPATFTESPRKKTRDQRTPEMQAYDHPRWPGICACGKEEKSKHKEGCLIGGAVTWDWYIDPATGKPPPHVQARLDAP